MTTPTNKEVPASEMPESVIIETIARLASQSLNITRMHEVGGDTSTIMSEAGVIEFAHALLALGQSQGEAVYFAHDLRKLLRDAKELFNLGYNISCVQMTHNDDEDESGVAKAEYQKAADELNARLDLYAEALAAPTKPSPVVESVDVAARELKDLLNEIVDESIAMNPGWQDKILAHTAAQVAKKNKRIAWLEALVTAYGPKSFAYDVEHPNDGLNGQSAAAPATPSVPGVSVMCINDLARQHGIACNCGSEGGGQNYYQFTVPELHKFARALLAAAPQPRKEM